MCQPLPPAYLFRLILRAGAAAARYPSPGSQHGPRPSHMRHARPCLTLMPRSRSCDLKERTEERFEAPIAFIAAQRERHSLAQSTCPGPIAQSPPSSQGRRSKVRGVEPVLSEVGGAVWGSIANARRLRIFLQFSCTNVDVGRRL